jgi:hypothetical protein
MARRGKLQGWRESKEPRASVLHLLVLNHITVTFGSGNLSSIKTSIPPAGLGNKFAIYGEEAWVTVQPEFYPRVLSKVTRAILNFHIISIV